MKSISCCSFNCEMCCMEVAYTHTDGVCATIILLFECRKINTTELLVCVYYLTPKGGGGNQQGLG